MEKELWKLVKRSKRRKNVREQGERGKISKGAGNKDPPNRASVVFTFDNVPT